MTDYIDREDALEVALEGCSSELIHHDLKRLPFVSIITCKDCKHYTVFPFGPYCIKSLETVETTDYCSKAEPKEARRRMDDDRRPQDLSEN